MSFSVNVGATDRSIEFTAINSTTGAAETLAYNTSGLTATYQRHIGGRAIQSAQSITLATLASATATHADGGIVHVGGGVHRLDLPDAAFASGADRVVVLVAKTGVVCVTPFIEIVNPTFTTTELSQIRYRLGIDGAELEPTNTPSLGVLDVSVNYAVFQAGVGAASGGVVIVQHSTLWTIALSGLPDPGLTDSPKLLFTIKRNVDETDAQATLQIVLSNPAQSSTDGVLRVNGEAATSGQQTKGLIVIDEDGQPTVSIAPEITALIAGGGYVWDIKSIDTSATPLPSAKIETQGTLNVNQVITRTHS